MPGPSCFFVPLRRFRSQLRGSALSLATDSDGKPCSGVRGDQQVSTATRRIALPFLRAGRGLPGPLSAAAPLERSFPS